MESDEEFVERMIGLGTWRAARDEDKARLFALARRGAAADEAHAVGFKDGATSMHKAQADEIERLRAALRNMNEHMEENITLTEALRHEQEWVLRLSKALRGVIRVADRNTAEFNEARAALGGSDG